MKTNYEIVCEALDTKQVTKEKLCEIILSKDNQIGVIFATLKTLNIDLAKYVTKEEDK